MTKINTVEQSLKEIASSHWTKYQQPVLLSNLPALLASKNSNYKELLNGKTLKQFVIETATNNSYKLIAHPTQKAKLGVVPLPEGNNYIFPDSQIIDKNAFNFDSTSEKTLLEFLKALKKLPEQDIKNINIPVSILVKMIK
jgi:hypothetical protein